MAKKKTSKKPARRKAPARKAPARKAASRRAGAGRAIDFYKQAFGAQELMRMPAPDGRGIWHAEIRIGDSVVYLVDEMPQSPVAAPSPTHKPTAVISLYVPDCDAVFQAAVQAGA